MPDKRKDIVTKGDMNLTANKIIGSVTTPRMFKIKQMKKDIDETKNILPLILTSKPESVVNIRWIHR